MIKLLNIFLLCINLNVSFYVLDQKYDQTLKYFSAMY
jgi:hypothetical protein